MDTVIHIELVDNNEILSVSYEDGYNLSYDALALVQDWLSVPPLDFRMMFGFYWLPPTSLIEQAEIAMVNLC